MVSTHTQDAQTRPWGYDFSILYDKCVVFRGEVCQAATEMSCSCFGASSVKRKDDDGNDSGDFQGKHFFFVRSSTDGMI